jgi:hypothetical protein
MGRSLRWFAMVCAVFACNEKSGPAPDTTGTAPEASTAPVTTTPPPPEPSAAPASPSGDVPAVPFGIAMKRAPEHDGVCDSGRKAFSADSLTELPKSTGCTGPSRVHYSMKHPKTGEMVDGETPVYCCTGAAPTAANPPPGLSKDAKRATQHDAECKGKKAYAASGIGDFPKSMQLLVEPRT